MAQTRESQAISCQLGGRDISAFFMTDSVCESHRCRGCRLTKKYETLAIHCHRC